MNKPDPQKAGKVWPFDDPSRVSAQGRTTEQVLGDCLAHANAHLRDLGMITEDLTPEAYINLRHKVEAGSRAEMALYVWGQAWNLYAQIGEMEPGSPGRRLASAAAGHGVALGMVFQILNTMRPGGITDRAAQGFAAAAGSERGKEGRALQAYNERMEAYGRIALKIATAVRAAQPRASLAEICRQVRDRWPQETSRPADGNLPRTDRQLERFLRDAGI